METPNTHITVVVYESRSFWDDCDKLFSRGEEFVVISEKKSIEKYRDVIKLYLKFEHEQPKGLARVIVLAKIWVASIRVGASGLLGVCIRAKHFRWVIISDDLQDNQLLHLKPR